MKKRKMSPQVRREVRQVCNALRMTIREKRREEDFKGKAAELKALEELCLDEAELRVEDVYKILRSLQLLPGQFFREFMVLPVLYDNIRFR